MIRQGGIRYAPPSSAPLTAGGIIVGTGGAVVERNGTWRLGNRCAAIGDSITQSNADTANGLAGSNSWFVRACLLSGGRMRYVVNAGVTGDTTAGTLARLQTDVIAHAPDRCIVLIGTNDIAAGTPNATITANLTAIYNQLLAAGIRPIPCTLTPRATQQAAVDQINRWIADYAVKHGLDCLDLHAQVVDPTTNAYLAAYTSDGLHPTPAGSKVLAQYAATALGAVLPYQLPYLAQADNDVGNLAATGTFAHDTNADGLADNWVAVGSASGVAYTLAADAANVVGNWQVVTVSTNSLRYLSQGAIPGWSVGDKLAFAGVVQASGTEAGGLTYDPRLVFNGATGQPGKIGPISGGSGMVGLDFTRGVFYAEAAVPAGTTSVEAQLLTNGGTGTVKFGQVSVANLTTLGLA